MHLQRQLRVNIMTALNVVPEGRPGSPDAEADHVGHVLGLRGAGGRRVYDPRLGQPLLQLQDSLTRLGRLPRSRRAEKGWTSNYVFELLTC